MKFTKTFPLLLSAAGAIGGSAALAEDMKLPSPEEQEVMAPNEDELIAGIQEVVLQRMRDTYPGDKTMKRDAHPKTHGLAEAKLVVEPHLPAEFRQGIFANGGEYDAVVRFSSSSQMVTPDVVQQPQGMAIKVLGVEGPKILEGFEDATTQDFVMINHPTFFVKDLDSYLTLFQAQVGEPEELKKWAEEHPDSVQTIGAMIAEESYNPAGIQYWSQTPYKFGDRVAKYTLRPQSGASNERPDVMLLTYQREYLVDTLKEGEVRYEFLIQLQKDVEKQPLENPMVEWMVEDTQPIRVATLIIPQQDISPEENLKVAEDMSFSVWHSLEEHRPLGAVNRARRPIYKAGAEQRREANGVEDMSEPTEVPNVNGEDG
ncbi:catalase family protein [Palleronia caenipelagi]|uniref:Catalase family protein n=1 Tax=Palleronia caenipelagi TaxID=2489174 RepID=A0A547Q2M7_9RHOB|nr:catalase family protein [Palleronia caenipelagi]TRD20646.1 catalase family protein [Palleronia caenipelagi]